MPITTVLGVAFGTDATHVSLAERLSLARPVQADMPALRMLYAVP